MSLLKVMFDNIDIHSQQNKYIATFVFSAILFFLLSPGTFVEIDPTSESKFNTVSKNKLASVAVHSVLFGAAMLAFYYIYLNKKTGPFF